ncbi:hypothetical protein KUCAC02_013254 [Chaenocephalus aceratus]|nr:hypothetical protein KUCAC02_013254 [Chaenocephalus aceratus]
MERTEEKGFKAEHATADPSHVRRSKGRGRLLLSDLVDSHRSTSSWTAANMVLGIREQIRGRAGPKLFIYARYLVEN